MGTAERGRAVTATSPDFPRRLRIGSVTVRTRSGRVHGPGGTRQLDPKVVAVLLRLAAADGHVVSRDTMMADVWPDVVVSDTALSRCVYQLRKVLGEVSDEDTSPIETLPKRGYRLAWPVKNGRPAPEHVPRGWLRLVALAAVTLATLLAAGVLRIPDRWTEESATQAAVRIAVFPPQDLSSKQDQRSFAIGLAREIAHELASLPGLAVIGRSSSFDESPRSASLVGMAEQLHADYALSGTIRAIGNSRRVLLDLRSLPGEEVLWSRVFVLETDAPFDVFGDVVAETARLLEFSVATDHPSGSTDNLAAFQSYLAAGSAPSYGEKQAHLERAVELDPGFARAWNRLAAIEVMPVWNGVRSVEDAWSRAEPNVTRALELVPDMPDALVTLGRFRREFGDLEGAIELFRLALGQDPAHAYALANLGLALRFAGRFEEALDVHLQGVAMDPLDALAVARLGTSYWFAGNFDEADRQYRRASELAPGNEEIYDSWSGMLANGMGRLDLALLKMEQKIVVEGVPTPRSLSAMASLADTLGLGSMADDLWLRAVRAAPEGSAVSAQHAAHMAARGEFEAAATLLTRSGLAMRPDPTAQLVLGLIDLRNDEAERFLDRVRQVIGGEPGQLLADPRSIQTALLMALAHQANGHGESAEAWLNAVEDAIGEPRAREHVWLAAVHAMRGERAAALRELERSPPGRVRAWAPFALHDARFASLFDMPQFEKLIDNHLLELEAQRVTYLAAHDTPVASLVD
jgi:DNA-binding winged helix-turn-helix (wHTH) protein/TolB-like protein